MDYTIPVHGIIGSPESKGDKNTYFSFNDLLMHIHNAKDADTLTLDIASDGGYCDIADKMINELQKTGKTIAAFNSGNVASAASKLFTLAQKDLRVFYPNRGLFLIHNPWNSTEGDAMDHLEVALALAKVEEDYINWYVYATGTEDSIISNLMSENVPLTADQIENFGFATIIQPTIQAFAKLKHNNTNMENEQVIKKLGVIESLVKTFTDKFSPKAILVNDADGNELEFVELKDISEIAVGSKVAIAGEAVTGEYILVDGTKLMVDKGIVTEIVAPTSTIVAVMYNDADGNVIEFPELNEGDEISLGVKILVNGEVITGEVYNSEGQKYIITDGILTAVETEEQETEVTVVALTEEEIAVIEKENTDLKAENEALKVELEAIKMELETATSTKAEMVSNVQALVKEVNTIKSLTSDYKVETAKPESTNTKSKFSYKK